MPLFGAGLDTRFPQQRALPRVRISREILPRCVISIDLKAELGSPETGDYLTTVGKTGVGSHYLILKVHKVSPRRPRELVRFVLSCERCVLEETVNGKVWWMHWYPRLSKKMEGL